MYIIRYILKPTGFIKKVIAPPRLCEWTEDINEAQQFEYKSEWESAVEYIKENAFYVEWAELWSGLKINFLK